MMEEGARLFLHSATLGRTTPWLPEDIRRYIWALATPWSHCAFCARIVVVLQVHVDFCLRLSCAAGDESSCVTCASACS